MFAREIYIRHNTSLSCHSRVGCVAVGGHIVTEGFHFTRSPSTGETTARVEHEGTQVTTVMPRTSYDIKMYPVRDPGEVKRQRKRTEFLDSIGINPGGEESFSELPHIYLPRLHRQKTEKVPSTKLGDVLKHMLGTGDYCDLYNTSQQHMSALHREVLEFTDWVLPRLKKCEHNMEFKQPFAIESYPPWRTSDKVISCVLPFALNNVRLKSLEPGYVVIQLPRRESRDADEYSKLRADDKLHLSPRKSYLLLTKILRRIFSKESIPYDRLHLVSDGQHSLFYDLRNYGWRIELIPAICLSKKTAALFVAKPFDIDENASSDMRWRVCWSLKEAEIIRSISCTDRGVRLQALYVVRRLCEKDWRLNTLTPYQIQTALLFDMDHHVDHSPRWQRSTLEECVISLLKKILYFAKSGYLPHFIVEGLDLFGLLHPKTVLLYKGSLERLTTNERALVSLAQRSRTEREHTLWLEPKESKVIRAHQQIPPYTGVV